MLIKQYLRFFQKKKPSMFVALAALVLLVLVLPLTIYFAKQQQQTQQYAATINNPDLFGISRWLDTNNLNQRADGYVSLGVKWARTDFAWPSIQGSNQTTYGWGTTDAVVSALTSRGIKVLGILDYTPTWELPSGCTDNHQCPPKSNADYAQYASAVASRYAPMGVHAWEIWNEPNGGTFSPASYTAMLKAAYAAIKQVDPTATVLAGGSEPMSTKSGGYAGEYEERDFLTGMYQNGAGGYFDALTHHPYCVSSKPNCPPTYADIHNDWSIMQDTNPSLRSLMIANGDSAKKIWATEFGAPTGGGTVGITEDEQATMLNDAYTLFNSYSWSGPMFWYTFDDPCTTTTSLECYYGILHNDFTPKPAYAVYKNLATAASALTATPTSMPTPTTTPAPQSSWRIDAGSTGNYTDTKGNTWQADTGITGGSIVDRGTITIANTTDPRIYQTEHYNMTSASYAVPNGNYTVNLDFAETTGSGVTGAGQRIFDVALNGITVLSNFDVYAQAGGTNIALMKTFTTTVTNGTMNITFTPHMNAPEINGIEILPQTSPTAAPTLTPIPTNTPIPTPTPTPLPTPTNTPVPTNTPTPIPTSTPVPTLTSTPIPTPTPIPPDTTPPTIAITSPANGTLVRHGSTITITASASDNVGVTQVQFLVNGTLLCNDTTSPYSCNWPVPGKPGITYTITARAYDAMGNAASNSIQVRSTQ